MPVQLSCSECGVRLQVHNRKVGCEIQCPVCGKKTTVQAPVKPPAPPTVEDWRTNPPPLRSTNSQSAAPLPHPAPNGDDPAPLVRFLCPDCAVQLSIDRLKTGSQIVCPKCRRPIIVPSPLLQPKMGILVGGDSVADPQQAKPPPVNLPPPPPLPPPISATVNPALTVPQNQTATLQASPGDVLSLPTATEDVGPDDVGDVSLRPHRTVNAIDELVCQIRLPRAYARITLIVALVCFFLPANEAYLKRDFVETGQDKLFVHEPLYTQSCAQAAVGWVTFHSLIRKSLGEELSRKESSDRKRSESSLNGDMAPWLLAVPIMLGIALIIQLVGASVSQANHITMILAFASFGVVALQAAAGFPMSWIGNSPLRYMLSAHYTIWFYLMMIALLASTVPGIVAWRRQSVRRMQRRRGAG